MKDDDKMPWGAHKGTKLGDVPFDYLYRLYKKQWLSGDILAWFEKQLTVLEEGENVLSGFSRRKPKKYIIENYECTFPGKKVEDKK